MKFAQVRQFALGLPETTEEPHFTYSSYRVRHKIFATVPPGEEIVHVFVPEEERDRACALYPEFLEKLFWGKRVVGLRVSLAPADAGVVSQLLSSAWSYKAPAALRTKHSASHDASAAPARARARRS